MPLQKEFRGFADLLGLYLGGKVPLELNANVNPVLNVNEFLQQYEYIQFQATLTALGQIVTSVPVPQGEYQRVRFLGLNDDSATDKRRHMPVIFDGINWFGLDILGLNITIGYAIGQTQHQGITFEGDGIPLFPGMAMGWELINFDGTTNTDSRGVYLRQRIKI